MHVLLAVYDASTKASNEEIHVSLLLTIVARVTAVDSWETFTCPSSLS
jgi:hypothetical protein